jgi:hypothetical protein
MRDYLVASGLTLAVEVPVYVAALRLVAAIGSRRAALWAVLVNLLTHPLLWWVLAPAARDRLGAGPGTATVEVWAVAVEAGVLWRLSRDPVVAVGAAVCANTCSFLLGAAVLG